MHSSMPHHFGVPAAKRSAGFTLIEMLVAASLVVMMMSIFAGIFQIAAGSMTKQRALAENDQQVRTAVTILRGDLQKRTPRNLVPFYPRENHEQQGIPFDNREGYFYINVNDANSGLDDVVQFTVRSTIKTDSLDDSPYYGRAAGFGDLRVNPNQPDADDGEIAPNGSASSTTAQVAYFVRNGNLYRRVILLREPLSVSGSSASGTLTINPRRSDNREYFDASPPMPQTPLYSGNFLEDFDFSAHWIAGVTQFIGVDASRNDLDNRLQSANFPLGRSRFRFGFDSTLATANSGLPREYFGASNNIFLGRFTHQETSDPTYQYPFGAAPLTNPCNLATVLNDSAPQDGIPDGYESGSRAGEDILLTNVHHFGIEVWDDAANGGAGGFVVLGSGTDYALANCLNNTYSPTGLAANGGRCFDTWHPFYDRDTGLDAATFVDNPNTTTMPFDPPPYRPLKYDPAANNSLVWNPTTSYTPGTIVFPPTEDANYNGELDSGEDGTNGFSADGVLDNALDGFKVPVSRHGRVYHYICRRGTTLNVSTRTLADQPQWSGIPGHVFGHANTQMELWEAVPNIKPLRAVRFTLRFLHRGSNKLRQVTIVHSLRDQ